MTKRYFKIELNGYGGEFCMGKSTPEFVKYWQARDEDQLVEHLVGANWDDEEMLDTESPDMTEDGNISMWECDDYVHLNSCYADNGYWVQEVALNDPSAWDEDYQTVTDPHENEVEIGDAVRHDNFEHWIGGREAYTCSEDTEGDDIVPVIKYHSSEKGNFGIAYVVTDGEEFDPELVGVAVVETDMAEFVEALYYGKQQLEICYDWADTNGKGTYAEVGYVKEAWLDEFDEDLIQETLSDIHEDSVEAEA